jgi:hypothetical protein
MKEILVLIGVVGAHITEPVLMVVSGAALLSLASAVRRVSASDVLPLK